MRIFQFFIFATPMASAFLHNFFQSPDPIVIRPDLLQITEKQEDKKLNIQLCIGHPDEAQMAITGMVIELHHEAADYEHVILPGADGPHRDLSTGHRRLDVLSEGHFVSLLGTRHVKTVKGCWEMCWRKDKPAGTLVCGFEIPQEYKRNAAVLPESKMFLSFPLWTAEGLKYGQEEKKKVQEEAQRFLEKRDEELYKFDMTDNQIMKALHLRSAFAADEKYNDMPHDTLELIPDDHEVINLQDDLLLTTNGVIWVKDAEFGSVDHTLLGLATIVPEVKKTRLMP
jgi:hypothetical protein